MSESFWKVGRTYKTSSRFFTARIDEAGADVLAGRFREISGVWYWSASTGEMVGFADSENFPRLLREEVAEQKGGES